MTTAYDRLRAVLEDNGRAVKDAGVGKFHAQCPAHDDRKPSLAVTAIAGSVLVHCHAGCAIAAVLDSIGWTAADLYDNPRGAEYVYPGGRRVHRTPGKKFAQSGNKADRSLFHVDRIADAAEVLVVEGEKDVLAAEAAGAAAVCPAMGAGKAARFDWTPLAGKRVTVVADADDPGRRHAVEVLDQVAAAGAAEVRMVRAVVGKDLADHIAAGRTLEDLAPIDVAPPKDDSGQPDFDPIPLTRSVDLPPFPVDSFPAPIAAMIRGVAEATQTDPAMAGISALSALAACTGGHAEIEVRPGWREPLCLYLATIAGPGERKSAVQRAMTGPILDVEEKLVDAGLSERLDAEVRRDVQMKAAEKLKNQAAAVANTDEWSAKLADALGAAELAESITVPPIPRLVADDVTPEAAASMMCEQGGRLAIISAEGGIFDIVAGRYSGNVPNMDLWLKGHAGDPLKVDRKGRPPEYIRKPALTLGLMIQPEVLNTIAGNRQFRGRGFLARILYGFPVSKVGHRKIGADPIAPNVEADYNRTVTKLAAGMAGWAGDPAVLTLTKAGAAAIIALEADIEPRLSGDGELAGLADWGAKYVGAVARIAGILHLAEHGPDGTKIAVTAETMLAAARIGAYFKAAAVRAFTTMGTDTVTADAVYLLERIGRLDPEQVEVSERELFTIASRARFKTKGDMMPALACLVDHGHLIPQPVALPTGGRPASPRYLIAKAAQRAKGDPA